MSLEGYYQWNANEPYDRISLLRAYDTRANTFGMQQTAVIVELAPDVAAGRRYGARVDLQFGQATAALQGSPANEPRPELYRNVWQAYGTYVFPVGRGLQTDFGKFASNSGTRPITRRTTTTSRARTCSTSCPTTTRACA